MRFLIVFAVCGLMTTGLARAAPIVITDVELPSGKVISILTPLAVTGLAGQLQLTTSTGLHLTAWCIDLYHDIYTGASQSLRFNPGPVSTNSHGQTLSALQTREIAGLATYGDAQIALGNHSADFSAAVQTAIWSIEYDVPALTYVAGPSHALVNSLIALAPALTGSATALIALDGQQTLITSSTGVPEPATLTVLGAAIACLAAARRKVRRALQ